MTRITLFPKTNSAQIDGALAQDVDFTGIAQNIHCIQWYDTVGTIEYVDDPITGAKPPNQTIDSITPYMAYVDQADAIIEAYTNPQIWYSTVNNNLWQGGTYMIGNEIEITTVNTLPPANTTQQVPPTPEDFQQLWYYDDEWVVSPFAPTLTLADAQSFLIQKVQISGGEQADYQARIYSAFQLASSGDPGSLLTADYYGLDLAAYQAYIDGEIATMTAQINAATSTTQLYSFDWRVEGNPNA